MREYVKIYCCGDCIHYDLRRHRCGLGAHEEGKATDNFYRDCPMGIHVEQEGRMMLIERRIREEIKESLKVTRITLLSIKEYEAAKEYIPLVNGWWWLRSPGLGSTSAAFVSSGGWVSSSGSIVSITDGVVRPALFISNLDSFNLKPRDRIIDFCGYDWTVIPRNMVLCDTGVGIHCFREDWGALDANDYKKSDVKTWLENWAKERRIIDAV